MRPGAKRSRGPAAPLKGAPLQQSWASLASPTPARGRSWPPWSRPTGRVPRQVRGVSRPDSNRAAGRPVPRWLDGSGQSPGRHWVSGLADMTAAGDRRPHLGLLAGQVDPRDHPVDVPVALVFLVRGLRAALVDVVAHRVVGRVAEVVRARQLLEGLFDGVLLLARRGQVQPAAIPTPASRHDRDRRAVSDRTVIAGLTPTCRADGVPHSLGRGHVDRTRGLVRARFRFAPVGRSRPRTGVPVRSAGGQRVGRQRRVAVVPRQGPEHIRLAQHQVQYRLRQLGHPVDGVEQCRAGVHLPVAVL